MISSLKTFILSIILLGISKASFAQEVEALLNPPFDVQKERAMIPGETMGQKMESLLFWDLEEKARRFPQMYTIFPSIEVSTGTAVSHFEEKNLVNSELQNKARDYMNANAVEGLIVVKDQAIAVEAYGNHADEKTLWTSFSVGKSVTSMLLGVALKEGDVESLEDELSKYIPELQDQDYGKVTVRQLLTMTSGIQWNEDYADVNSDVAQMYKQPCEGEEAHILSYMKNMKSIHAAGDKWNYSTGETDLLGILIQKATGKSLAEYLSEKLWQLFGMEHTAYWLADECSMMNLGGSGLSASLRDFARLGLLMINENSEIFDSEWQENATALLFPTGEEGGGYGYLWWRFANGSYAAFGIFGQMIYINPQENLIIAQYASWPQAGSAKLSQQRMAFIKEVEKQLQTKK